MDRKQLLNSLTELDFMAMDLALFLNTHPKDTDAIAIYNQVIAAADIVRMKYEKNYGPLCSFRSYAEDTEDWQWKNDPWPWQREFNYSLGGKECL